MYSQFTFNWTPAPDAVSQLAKWRVKNVDIGWHIEFVTPANPLGPSIDEAVLYTDDNDFRIKENTIYQFQVDSFCTESTELPFNSNTNGIVEKISLLDRFDENYGIGSQSITNITTTSAKLSLNFNGHPFLTKIRIRTKKVSDSTLVSDNTYDVLQYISPSVTNGIQTFTVSGLTANTNYYWELEFYSVVNGVEVKSTDIGQISVGEFFNQGNSGSEFDLIFTTLT